MNEEKWVFKEHNNDTIEVTSTTKFQKERAKQNQLQQHIEQLPFPTDHTVDLVKRIQQQLPITNWAWKLTKQREYAEELKKEKQRTTQQTFNYPTRSKQPDDGFELG